MQRFRGGLVFKAHRLCVRLNSRLEGNNEEEPVDEEAEGGGDAPLLAPNVVLLQQMAKGIVELGLWGFAGLPLRRERSYTKRVST